MQLTHKEIDEKRIYTLLTNLNDGKSIDMKEMNKLCKSLGYRIGIKTTMTGNKIYGLMDV